ncbi:MAG: hypothetical protein ACRDD5_16070 [Silvania sp.]|jgi:hypothetical protein|uniref:Uncharacterized protein n=1 Tax=Silvania hatchlandensis TaxID=2926469 RepID=A0A9J6Q0N6_9ENTR|nr:hypothetical protein [Silvania hatchlandensis]MCU6664380.1 hypothetical protein [Silvania hatchlandensis]
MLNENTISQLYSELELNTPDLATLAARCNLLTEILVDCDSLPQTQPIARCLAAYLEAFNAELEKSMTDFRVLDDDELQPAQRKEWLLDSTETQCDYCRALNHVLLVSHFDRDQLPHLTGLLHDITHSMLADMTVVSIH